MGDMLHHHSFAAFRGCDQECALPFAYRRDDVNHPTRDVLVCFDVLPLQPHLHLWEQRCEVFKHHLVLVVLRAAAIDPVQLVERKVALAVFWRSNLPFDHVAGVQVETAHLAGADVDVVGAGGVAGVGAAQKAEAVGQYFEHAVCNDLLAGSGTLFDNGKHQLLFAHAASVFNFKLFSLFEDFRHMQCLEFI